MKDIFYMTQLSFSDVKSMPFSTIPWHSKISIAIKQIFFVNQKLFLIFIVQIVSTPATGIAIKHLFC